MLQYAWNLIYMYYQNNFHVQVYMTVNQTVQNMKNVII